MNSSSPASGHSVAKAHGHAAKRSKRNLMLMGSAAVIAVYTAGFFRTAEAMAKLAADEQSRSGSPGRGGDRESARPESSPAPVRAATVANLPLAVPSTPPPVAATSPFQTPTPAPSPIPAAAPAAAPVAAMPAVAPAVSTVTALASAPATPVPASAPNPVPTSPIQVAALPVAPVTTTSANVTPAAQLAVAAVKKKYKDGAYFGWGRCRHGELKVIVEVKDDQIVSAVISECYTQYSKNVISRLPKQLTDRQVPEKLDRVSGASDSSDAFYYAVVEALKAAKL